MSWDNEEITPAEPTSAAEVPAEELRGEKRDEELVRDVARRVITHLAPQEVASFEATAAAFFQAPARVRRNPDRSKDVLGFGLESVIEVLSPVVLLVTVEVFKYLAETSVRAGVKKVGGLFRRKKKTPAILPRLDSDQLEEVRRFAKQRAAELRVSDDQAQAIADGITAELATRSHSLDRDSPPAKDSAPQSET